MTGSPWYDVARHIGELGLVHLGGLDVEVIVRDARYVGGAGLYRRLQLYVTPTKGKGSIWIEAKSWTRYPPISQPGVRPGR